MHRALLNKNCVQKLLKNTYISINITLHYFLNDLSCKTHAL